jgi:hypothetical protein
MGQWLLSKMKFAKHPICLERANVDMTCVFILCSVVAGLPFSFLIVVSQFTWRSLRVDALFPIYLISRSDETFLGTAAGWLGHDEPESAGGIGLNPGDDFCG